MKQEARGGVESNPNNVDVLEVIPLNEVQSDESNNTQEGKL